MIRKSLKAKKKEKSTRIGKTELYHINSKYLGGEPEFKAGHILTEMELIRTFTWYNYTLSVSDARIYLREYIERRYSVNVISEFNKIPDEWVPLTAGWIARLFSRGYRVVNGEQFINNALANAAYRIPIETVEIERPRSPHDFRLHALISEIEGIIDNTPKDFNFQLWLQSKDAPLTTIPTLIEKYSEQLYELIQAYEGEELDLVEAYRGYSKNELFDKIKLLNNIVSGANIYRNEEKKPRKPRAAKLRTPDQILKHFKPQKEHSVLGISSVDSKKVLDSDEVWLFHTGHYILTVLRAASNSSFQVNRSYIIGIDKNNSVSKRVGRRTQEILNTVLSNGKVTLASLMGGIGSKEVKLQEHVNNQTILLKIFKKE